MRRPALALIALGASVAAAQRPVAATSPLAEFNKSLQSATFTMNDSATLALWDDAGVSLLPNAAPVVDKAAITKYFRSITSQLKGAKMERFDLRCFDDVVSGALASEWCVEHQIVRLGDGSTFDGWGKLSFALRRTADGRWRLTQEVWLPATAADSTLIRPSPR